jgi:hypothetical protein
MRTATLVVILLIVIFLAGLWRGRLNAPFRTTPLACYSIVENAPNIPVTLTTQFGAEGVTVLAPEFLCTPVTKKLPEGIRPKPVTVGDHLQCYKIELQPDKEPDKEPDNKPAQEPSWILDNQIEKDKNLTIGEAKYLCEPTDKTKAE